MKTPVTLLTGFLGSGKSTLLSQILQDPAFAHSAVIVNEFGDVGLDHVLVTHSQEQILEMTTGCLCCTIRGDISETLLDLWDRRQADDLPAFERVIIETTGLADPAPVIHTITSDPEISDRFELAGIVTTVDAANGQATLARQEECVKQVAVADRIVLTKTDLKIDAEDLDKLVRQLDQLNPAAELLDRQSPDFKLDSLFDTGLFDEVKRGPDIQKWLQAERVSEAYDPGHARAHDHAHDHVDPHDVNRHGEDIQTFSLIIDEPVFSQSFVLAMQLLLSDHGENLLRIKGVICLRERQDQPFVIHGVQHVFHEPIELEEWPDADRRSKIVFITRKISKPSIEAYFASWLKVDEHHHLMTS